MRIRNNFADKKGARDMNDKQRAIFRIIIAVIFVIGGGVYLFQRELLCAVAFILVGILFGFKAIKGGNKEG